MCFCLVHTLYWGLGLHYRNPHCFSEMVQRSLHLGWLWSFQNVSKSLTSTGHFPAPRRKNSSFHIIVLQVRNECMKSKLSIAAFAFCVCVTQNTRNTLHEWLWHCIFGINASTTITYNHQDHHHCHHHRFKRSETVYGWLDFTISQNCTTSSYYINIERSQNTSWDHHQSVKASDEVSCAWRGISIDSIDSIETSKWAEQIRKDGHQSCRTWS